AQRFDVAQAKAFGIVDRIADTSTDVLVVAHELARSISRNAPLSVKGMKFILNALAAGSAGDQESEINELIGTAIDSEDYKNAVQAFADKRQPKFLGR
ncbi:MAG: enoyl-CoA hydratase-related protein, partial [Gammaproteobacteria bacterium]